MLSLQKKFLFIHIPKTAGDSIENFLKDYSDDEIICQAKNKDGIEQLNVLNKKYNTNKHSTLFDYKTVLDSETYSTLFKFAAIRNPWDMMISFYFSPYRDVTKWDRKDFLKLLKKVKPLRHFLCKITTLERRLEEKLGIRINIGNKKIGDEIDFLIRFEQLDNDFKLVCEKLDIPYSPLPKKNKSSHKHYSTYYDDKLKEAVRKKFIDEIKYGNYEFENA